MTCSTTHLSAAGTSSDKMSFFPKIVPADWSVVYKKAFDTSRGGRTMPASHTTAQYTIQVAFLRKDARSKNNYTLSMGVHRNEILVLTIIFILFINGGAQEGNHNFFQ